MVAGSEERLRALRAQLEQRRQLVSAAAAHKADKTQVAAPRRVELVIANVRQTAIDVGLDPDDIETRYRRLTAHFIAWEHKCFDGNGANRAVQLSLELSEIRTRIDALDREIVHCLALDSSRLEPGMEPRIERSVAHGSHLESPTTAVVYDDPSVAVIEEALTILLC